MSDTETSATATSDRLKRSEKVARIVEIYEVRLVELHTHLTELRGELPPLRSNTHGAKVLRKDKEGARVEVSFSFKVADDTDESKADPPVSIVAVFSLTYRLGEQEEFEDEDIQAFAEVNAVYNAWPFWREIVYTTLSRMGLPPITLPVFRNW